jgi:hypothetical protein
MSASWLPSQPLAPPQAPLPSGQPFLRRSRHERPRCPAVVAVGHLAAATAVGAPVGIVAGTTVAGHPPAGLLFLAAGAGAPNGPVAGVTGLLDTAAIVGAPIGTAAGAASPSATAAVVGLSNL